MFDPMYDSFITTMTQEKLNTQDRENINNNSNKQYNNDSGIDTVIANQTIDSQVSSSLSSSSNDAVQNNNVVEQNLNSTHKSNVEKLNNKITDWRNEIYPGLSFNSGNRDTNKTQVQSDIQDFEQQNSSTISSSQNSNLNKSLSNSNNSINTNNNLRASVNNNTTTQENPKFMNLFNQYQSFVQSDITSTSNQFIKQLSTENVLTPKENQQSKQQQQENYESYFNDIESNFKKWREYFNESMDENMKESKRTTNKIIITSSSYS
ncbi:hypothetical protein DLAC_08091 [Tieghemostelium lacteum]|uniref:Uncharacterized protein n=1 Tax=Tieghemostelium lacteum TaxID=361077 RepID=A0A151ZB60_TIELA|nr:hypothetical protein DLAC_08091 [Tieghemostelium lacteum]|eukprot:KYQ91179.1 hypothetical protein DLAC_08091 [Tieghemostelium lacteum]